MYNSKYIKNYYLNSSINIFLAAIIIILIISSYYNFLFFHSIVELFSIIIAFIVFVIALYTPDKSTNHFLVFLGIAYLFIGSFDLLHTLAYKGMGVFPNIGANLPTQLWIIARYMEAISFIVALRYIKSIKYLNIKNIFSTFTVLSSILLLSLYYNLFPDSFIEGSGLTNFKIISEYIISFIFILSLYILYKNKDYFEGYIYKLIFISIIMTIISEISFTFYIDVYGVSNIIGHIFKLLSVLLIFKAIIESGFKRPYDLIFRQLTNQNQKIKEQNILFENIYNNIEQGLCLHEIIYDENNNAVDYRILDVNKAYEKILNIKRDRAVGALGSNIYHIDKAPFLKIYAETSKTGKVQSFEEYYHPQDKYFYITVTSPKKGQFITLFADITEIKEKEKELKNKFEEVKKLNKQLESLISIVNRLSLSSKYSINSFLEDILNISLELIETADFGSVSCYQNDKWHVINSQGYTKDFVSKLNQKRDFLLSEYNNIFDHDINIINNQDVNEKLILDSGYKKEISEILSESMFFDISYKDNMKIRVSLDISSSSEGKRSFTKNDTKTLEAFRSLIHVFISQKNKNKTEQNNIFFEE